MRAAPQRTESFQTTFALTYPGIRVNLLIFLGADRIYTARQSRNQKDCSTLPEAKSPAAVFASALK
jgi:hypothetical protein